jgi:hypothetical protein
MPRKTNTWIKLDYPIELPSVEEFLKTLFATLRELSEPGLSVKDIRRLGERTRILRKYQVLFREYVHYRKIEIQLIKYALEYEALSRRQQSRAF